MSDSTDNAIMEILRKHGTNIVVGETCSKVDAKEMEKILLVYNDSICNVIKELGVLTKDENAHNLLSAVAELIHKFRPEVQIDTMNGKYLC